MKFSIIIYHLIICVSFLDVLRLVRLFLLWSWQCIMCCDLWSDSLTCCILEHSSRMYRVFPCQWLPCTSTAAMLSHSCGPIHVVAFSLLRYPCTCDVFKHYYRSTMYFPCSSLHRLLRGQAFTVQAVLQLVFIYVTTRLCPSRIRYDSNLKFLIHLWNIFPLVFLLVRVFLVCLPCGLHLSIQRTMIIASIIYYGRHYHTEETSAGASL